MSEVYAEQTAKRKKKCGAELRTLLTEEALATINEQAKQLDVPGVIVPEAGKKQ
jgi:hypothetical protein